jgi:hypothetical protein
MIKCLDTNCDYSGPLESYIQDKNPPPGNTGCWCPKCEYTVLITKDGNIDYSIDEESLILGLKLLGKIDIDPNELN